MAENSNYPDNVTLNHYLSNLELKIWNVLLEHALIQENLIPDDNSNKIKQNFSFWLETLPISEYSLDLEQLQAKQNNYNKNQLFEAFDRLIDLRINYSIFTPKNSLKLFNLNLFVFLKIKNNKCFFKYSSKFFQAFDNNHLLFHYLAKIGFFANKEVKAILEENLLNRSVNNTIHTKISTPFIFA